MKVKLTRQSLVLQIPALEGVANIPPFVVLDGIPSNPIPDIQVRKFPKIAEILSRTQWLMFAELERMGEADYVELGKYCRKAQPASYKNLVSGHVAMIRRKFRMHKVPYRIKSLRMTHRRFSAFQLIALEDAATMRHNT